MRQQIHALSIQAYDLLILDLGLPGGDTIGRRRRRGR